MVKDGAFSRKINYSTNKEDILEGHPNHITGSSATAILLHGWTFPVGGHSAVEGLGSMGLPPVMFLSLHLWIYFCL